MLKGLGKFMAIPAAVLFLSLHSPNAAFPLDTSTHMAFNSDISEKAVNNFNLDSFLKNNLGMANGIDEILNGFMVKKHIERGGFFEDKPDGVLPYIRSANHFHNPLTDKGFSGVWDLPFVLSGQSAVIWSQNPAGAQSPGGHYSWLDIREDYYQALIKDNSSQRSLLFAETFRGIGQLMHLVQDMSVPEHSRDDGHYTDAYEEWVADLENPTAVSVVNAALNNPKYPDPALLVRPSSFADAPVPIANLFDSNQYIGNNPAATVSLGYGLSEYSNANFVTADSIFTADFPYPRWSSVSEYDQVIDAVSGKTRTYLRKVADGETVEHLATGRWFFKYLPTMMKSQGYGLKLDDKVYADYAGLLLPRAVGYSAVLMGYFFRGSLELTIPNQSDERYSDLHLMVRNTTSNDDELINAEDIKLVVRYKQMKEDGSGKLIKDGDDYRYLVAPVKNAISTIPKNTAVNLEFDLSASPLPLWAYDVTLQVVVKGQLGNESHAVAVGMVTLPSIGGDIQLSLPDRGVYGITAPDGSFSEFRIKAANVSGMGDSMTSGKIELVLRYKSSDEDPFQDQSTSKSPLDPEYFYIRISEKNHVSSLPGDLVFDLSQSPLPLWATDVSAFIVYTGQVGTKSDVTAVGFRDIAEPTPIDIVNNMDHVCINGNYLVAGSQDAINGVGIDGSGRPKWDIYPHRLKDVFVSFSSSPASATNYSAKFPDIEPGAYGRVFVLTDYDFKFSSSVTVGNIYGPLTDVWGWGFETTIYPITGVFNQMAYENGQYIDYYPGMYTERGLKSWWYNYFENPEWPNGTSCDSSTATPNLTGPASVEFPQ